MKFNPEAFATAVAEKVKGLVDPIRQYVDDRLKSMQDKLDAIPEPQQGEKGEPGEAGKDGAAGPQGEPGEVGEKGDPGDKGDQGEAGRDGKDGEQGPKGDPGDPGPQGDAGTDGAKGDPGLDGRDGRDGQDGRDALDIEVIEGINEEKSYPRGTVASHNGSLWMARRNTDGMEGWRCIVAGMGEPRIESDGERAFTITIPYGGTEIVHKAILPIVLDAGFYNEGKEYQKGDGVTFGGSFWIAKEETTTKPRIDSPAWRLAVKKGRDARGGL